MMTSCFRCASPVWGRWGCFSWAVQRKPRRVDGEAPGHSWSTMWLAVAGVRSQTCKFAPTKQRCRRKMQQPNPTERSQACVRTKRKRTIPRHTPVCTLSHQPLRVSGRTWLGLLESLQSRGSRILRCRIWLPNVL